MVTYYSAYASLILIIGVSGMYNVWNIKLLVISLKWTILLQRTGELSTKKLMV